MTNHTSSRSSYSDQLRTIAALLGGSGVALGAYGAHGLIPKNTSMTPSAVTIIKENWKTAVMYQLIHAVSILTLSAIVECKEQVLSSRTVSSVSSSSTTTSSTTAAAAAEAMMMLHRAGQVMAVGTVLFSGSIYLLCWNVGPKYIWGPTTPIGGMLMIAGWVMMLSNAHPSHKN